MAVEADEALLESEDDCEAELSDAVVADAELSDAVVADGELLDALLSLVVVLELLLSELALSALAWLFALALLSLTEASVALSVIFAA